MPAPSIALPLPNGRHLTPRELEALVRLAKGEGIEDAAAKMGITPSTLKNHTAAIYNKLGSGSLIGTYVMLGWLRPPETAA